MTAKPLTVKMREGLALPVPLLQVTELDAEQGCLYFIKPRVSTNRIRLESFKMPALP